MRSYHRWSCGRDGGQQVCSLVMNGTLRVDTMAGNNVSGGDSHVTIIGLT